jgi:DNA polymerase-1
MSCSKPNLQNLPRGDYRRCIVAPPGRVLVKADYSQIELRIAAKVSGDEALLEAYRNREDLHVLTAQRVLGVGEVSPEDRQLAKALNFGLLYGMGARGLKKYAKSEYDLELTEEEAQSYREAFFHAYPGLARWHRETKRAGWQHKIRYRLSPETRTLTGRRRLIDDKTSDMQRLNSPVQGTGADGLKLALALLWERRAEVPGAFPVLAVHDEIVIEAGEGQAGDVADWLKRAMIEAMAPLIEPVPVQVDVAVSTTWGGK